MLHNPDIQEFMFIAFFISRFCVIFGLKSVIFPVKGRALYRSCRKLRALYRISECQKELRLDSDVKCHQIAQNGEAVLLMTNLSRKTENPTIVSGAIPV